MCFKPTASETWGHMLICTFDFNRMASRNAAKYTEDGRIDEKRSSQFPAFERAILQYANTCLDEWRDKCIETANSLVRDCCLRMLIESFVWMLGPMAMLDTAAAQFVVWGAS